MGARRALLRSPDLPADAFDDLAADEQPGRNETGLALATEQTAERETH